MRDPMANLIVALWTGGGAGVVALAGLLIPAKIQMDRRPYTGRHHKPDRRHSWLPWHTRALDWVWDRFIFPQPWRRLEPVFTSAAWINWRLTDAAAATAELAVYLYQALAATCLSWWDRARATAA